MLREIVSMYVGACVTEQIHFRFKQNTAVLVFQNTNNIELSLNLAQV